MRVISANKTGCIARARRGDPQELFDREREACSCTSRHVVEPVEIGDRCR